MKVSKDNLALNVFRDQSELSERLLIVLQISQRDLKYTTLQTITS